MFWLSCDNHCEFFSETSVHRHLRFMPDTCMYRTKIIEAIIIVKTQHLDATATLHYKLQFWLFLADIKWQFEVFERSHGYSLLTCPVTHGWVIVRVFLIHLHHSKTYNRLWRSGNVQVERRQCFGCPAMTTASFSVKQVRIDIFAPCLTRACMAQKSSRPSSLSKHNI